MSDFKAHFLSSLCGTSMSKYFHNLSVFIYFSSQNKCCQGFAPISLRDLHHIWEILKSTYANTHGNYIGMATLFQIDQATFIWRQ